MILSCGNPLDPLWFSVSWQKNLTLPQHLPTHFTSTYDIFSLLVFRCLNRFVSLLIFSWFPYWHSPLPTRRQSYIPNTVCSYYTIHLTHNHVLFYPTFHSVELGVCAKLDIPCLGSEIHYNLDCFIGMSNVEPDSLIDCCPTCEGSVLTLTCWLCNRSLKSLNSTLFHT